MSNALLNILLIEDNPGDAELLRMSLRTVVGQPHEIDHAIQLGEGIERLHDRRYDVALLDLSLPDSTGPAAVGHLIEHCEELPIVVLSGNDDDRVAVEAVRNGAQDYLIKSSADGYAILRSLRYAIERKRAELAVQDSERARVAVEMAATAAHEISQPLSAILGATELLISGGGLSEDATEDVRMIQRSAGRIREIVAKLEQCQQYASRRYAGATNIVDLDSAGKSPNDPLN